MKGVPFGLLGKVDDGGKLTVKGLKGNTVIDSGLKKLKSAWQGPFNKLMHVGK